MAVKVMIPTPLRAYADKKIPWNCRRRQWAKRFQLLPRDLAELQKHLYGEDGKLRSFVNVYLNDEDIRYLEKEKTQ